MYPKRKSPSIKKLTAHIPAIPLWIFILSCSFLPYHNIKPYGTNINITQQTAAANIENMLSACPAWIFPNCRSAVPVNIIKLTGATASSSKFLRNSENFSRSILVMELHYVHAHPKYAKHTNAAIRDAIVASPHIPTLHRALFLSLMPFAVTIPNGIKLPTKHINNMITGKSLSGGCLSVNITYIIIQNHKTIMLTGSSMTRATENSTPLKDSHL